MTDFLLKSTISLTLLLAVYFLFLEKEKMHQFNRFFLLFSLVFSMVIPFISFEIYVETIQTIQQDTVQALPFSAVKIQEKTNYLPLFLWSIYGVVTTALLSRFIVHLIKIQQKIKKSTTQKIQNATLVLLNEKVLPHTFLNYIFINKDDFENKKIEGELFSHELTHVRQKHTLDILFIELLKTILWFNPILIFYKKAIQLNHEFLADENVVKSYNNVPFYQNLLLEKASWNNNFYLASNLNFLVTKKRLIMMTKTTSQSRALLKKLAVVPVIAGLIFISCTENAVESKPAEKLIVPSSKNPIELSPETVVYDETTVESVDVNPEDLPSMPEFPGGIAAFYKFVSQEFKIPHDYKGDGNIILSISVAVDGTLEETKVIKDAGFGTGDEGIRIMKNSPKWKPALLHGKPTKVQFYLPIQLIVK